MRRTFFKVADIAFSKQHDCRFVTVENARTGTRYSSGEFVFPGALEIGEELVKLTRDGRFVGYRRPTGLDRVICALGW